MLKAMADYTLTNGKRTLKLIIMKMNSLSSIPKEGFQIHSYCYDSKEK